MTGTVTAEKSAGFVTLTIRVPTDDFLDLVSGFAWIDLLGGFAAWRTVLPIAGQPPRLAGQFNLRRTYEQRESTAATDQPGAAASAAEVAPGTAVAPIDGADEAGSGERDCGCGKAARAPVSNQPGGLPADIVPQSAREDLRVCPHPRDKVRGIEGAVVATLPPLHPIECTQCGALGHERDGEWSFDCFCHATHNAEIAARYAARVDAGV